jgi:hypothetical protein
MFGASSNTDSLFGMSRPVSVNQNAGADNLFKQFGTTELTYADATNRIQDAFNMKQDLESSSRAGPLTTYNVADPSIQMQILIEKIPEGTDASVTQVKLEEYCRLSQAMGVVGISPSVGQIQNNSAQSCFLMNIKSETERSMLVGMFTRKFTGTLQDMITRGNGMTKQQVETATALIADVLALSIENGVMWYYLNPQNILVQQDGPNGNIVQIRFSNVSPDSLCVGLPMADKAKLSAASAFRCRQQALGTQRALHLLEVALLYRMQILLLMIKLFKLTSNRRVPFGQSKERQLNFLRNPQKNMQMIQHMLSGEKGGVAQTAMTNLLQQLASAVDVEQPHQGPRAHGWGQDSSSFILTLFNTLSVYLQNRNSQLSQIDLLYTSNDDENMQLEDVLANEDFLNINVVDRISPDKVSDLTRNISLLGREQGLHVAWGQGGRINLDIPEITRAGQPPNGDKTHWTSNRSMDWTEDLVDPGVDKFADLPDPDSLSRYALVTDLTDGLIYKMGMGWPAIGTRLRKRYLLRVARAINNFVDRDMYLPDKAETDAHIVGGYTVVKQNLNRISEVLRSQLGDSWDPEYQMSNT